VMRPLIEPHFWVEVRLLPSYCHGGSENLVCRKASVLRDLEGLTSRSFEGAEST
jgi:hypothetical protein